MQIEVERISSNEVVIAPLYQHLLKIIDVEKLEQAYELYIVLLMSILPDSFVKIEDIFSIFLYRESQPQKVLNAINNLHKKGLIIRSSDEIKMHRMIQDVVRIQLSTYLYFADILNSVGRSIIKANNSFSNKGYQIAAYTDSILSKLQGDKASGIRQPIILIKNHLYLMYRYLGEQENANRICLDLINDPNLGDILSTSSPKFRHMIHHDIGTYYLDTGDLPKAEQYFIEAIEVNGEELNIDVINSYNALFGLYYQQKKIEDALKYAGLALEVYNKFPDDDHDDVFANLLNNMGIVNSDLGRNNPAVFFITAALKTYREYTGDKKNDGMLALIYTNAATIFSRVGNHEVTIQFALHAISCQAKLRLERDETLITYYFAASNVYEHAGMLEEAKQMKQIAIELKNKF